MGAYTVPASFALAWVNALAAGESDVEIKL